MRPGAFLIFAVAAATLAGCDAMPRDIAGTGDRVAASGVVRIGITAPLGRSGERFVARLAAETAARPLIVGGSLEPLVDALDHGRIDVLVAPIRRDALIAEEIALTPPLDGPDAADRPVALRAAARNGENAWIMRIEHLARQGGGQ